ncbi:hypothetical protein [Pseudomonas agarici]|uniref:hypothetical protein n=1 Tax=Pseudomonas agarici TaxID=46677 RepID=UPI000B2E42C1|nr:hypothetical protein [Pseudomonas agarici]NWB94062.1 hypothetical protein [Pseudomonas agarici]NWC11783.1 hypothetical protein [Pseudomonas agarici]
MEVPAAAKESDGHASLFCYEGVIVGEPTQNAASGSEFFAPVRTSVKREKSGSMHKKN